MHRHTTHTHTAMPYNKKVNKKNSIESKINIMKMMIFMNLFVLYSFGFTVEDVMMIKT